MPVFDSVSVILKAQDSRCKYWAKIIRSGEALPLPESVSGASDIPAPYLKQGTEELLPGDFLIYGEENHHKKMRGWSYWLEYVDSHGLLRSISRPGQHEKNALKLAGMAPDLLKGSGELAAAIRCAHGVRLGLMLGTLAKDTIATDCLEQLAFSECNLPAYWAELGEKGMYINGAPGALGKLAALDFPEKTEFNDYFKRRALEVHRQALATSA